ncbi:MAG: serine protease [Granulosicoccus sp.]
MLRIPLMVLLLISGSTVYAVDPEVSQIAQMVAIAPMSSQSQQITRTSCVGTLIADAKLVTASHCLPDSLEFIAVRCLGQADAPTIVTPVLKQRHHVNQDVAVVHFEAQQDCHTSLTNRALTHDENQELLIYSQRSLQLHDLTILLDQTSTYVVSDSSCQTQGDSGSPVFTRTQAGKFVLTAMLVSGTSECPSLQILTKLSKLQDWLQ